MGEAYEKISFLGKGGQGSVEALFRAGANVVVISEEETKYAHAQTEYLQKYEREYFPLSSEIQPNVDRSGNTSFEEYRKAVALNKAKAKFRYHYMLLEIVSMIRIRLHDDPVMRKPSVSRFFISLLKDDKWCNLSADIQSDCFTRNVTETMIRNGIRDKNQLDLIESIAVLMSSKGIAEMRNVYEWPQNSLPTQDPRRMPAWMRQLCPGDNHYLKVMEVSEFPCLPVEMFLCDLKGLSSVFFQTMLAFPTAKKTIHCAYVEDKNRAEREVYALRAMVHRNIVSYHNHSWDSVKEIATIYTELCGPSLRHFISDQRYVFNEPVKIFWSYEMVCAVSYLKSKNILHRDIKPDNYLVVHSGPEMGRLKLCDFGNALVFTDPDSEEYRAVHQFALPHVPGSRSFHGPLEYDEVSNDTSSAVGSMLYTPSYIAPEADWDANSFTSESDLYSVGVTIWEIITRSHPSKFVYEELSETTDPLLALVYKCTAPIAERISVKDAHDSLLKIIEVKVNIPSNIRAWEASQKGIEHENLPVIFERLFASISSNCVVQSVDRLQSNLNDLQLNASISSTQTSTSHDEFSCPSDFHNSTQASSAYTGESTRSAKLDPRYFKLDQ